MTFKLLRRCLGVGSLALVGSAVGCGPINAPGPQDDVVVRAPGVLAQSDDHGVSVKAPLGVEVTVGSQGVVVKAPGVDVKTDVNGFTVKAPLVDIKSDANGTAVNAPLVTVRTGNTTQP